MLKKSHAVGIIALLSMGACRGRMGAAHEAASLLATDRAWSHVTASGNPDSVVAYCAHDARAVMIGQPVIQGKAQFRAMAQASFATPGFHITWTPDSAVVSQSGDLGYTFGNNAVTAPDSAGKLSTEVARYITVWRKGQDGKWRCVMDYATPGPAETPRA